MVITLAKMATMMTLTKSIGFVYCVCTWSAADAELKPLKASSGFLASSDDNNGNEDKYDDDNVYKECR